jgi:hypothetical protein
MPLVPNPHVYPPDGYFFVDSGGIRHTGTSWSELATTIKQYRIQNGIPIGNVVAEIYEFTCDRFPEGCRQTETVFVAKKQLPKEPSATSKLASAVHRWLHALVKALGTQPAQTVSPTEAQRRADICKGCIRQANWTLDCGSCAGAAFRLGLALRKGRDVKAGDTLRACSVLGEDTRTSVWLDRLKPSEDESLPKNCWRRGP